MVVTELVCVICDNLPAKKPPPNSSLNAAS